jgi:hypothetical protein
VDLEFGCSINQASSSTNNTADSDWQQSEEKSYCTRSSDSASDSCFSLYQNDPSSLSDAKHHSRPKPNFLSNADSQDSEYQNETHGNTHKNCDECEKENTKNISLQKSEDEDSECQGVLLLKGQFGALIIGFFPFFEKYPHSDTCVCIGHGYDKVGRCYQNNQGLTKHIQYGLVKKKKTIFGLNSQVQYLNIPWAMHVSNEYIKAIDKIFVDKSHNKVECRIITAKLLFFPIKLLAITCPFLLLLFFRILGKTTPLHQYCAILILSEVMATNML